MLELKSKLYGLMLEWYWSIGKTLQQLYQEMASIRDPLQPLEQKRKKIESQNATVTKVQ